jgi:hypothetical protein
VPLLARATTLLPALPLLVPRLRPQRVPMLARATTLLPALRKPELLQASGSAKKPKPELLQASGSAISGACLSQPKKARSCRCSCHSNDLTLTCHRQALARVYGKVTPILEHGRRRRRTRRTKRCPPPRQTGRRGELTAKGCKPKPELLQASGSAISGARLSQPKKARSCRCSCHSNDLTLTCHRQALARVYGKVTPILEHGRRRRRTRRACALRPCQSPRPWRASRRLQAAAAAAAAGARLA